MKVIAKSTMYYLQQQAHPNWIEGNTYEMRIKGRVMLLSSEHGIEYPFVGQSKLAVRMRFDVVNECTEDGYTHGCR